MATVLQTNIAIGCNLDDEKAWEGLFKILRVCTRHWVYSSHLSAWKECEEDIVDDIVQETLCRCFEYAKRAERGEVLPICSLNHMAIRIAHNYYIDLLRRDKRLLHSSKNDSLFDVSCARTTPINPFEMALERVSQEELFTFAAHKVAHFPKRQREALLTDLANRMSFGEVLTPLQKAFAEVGIDMQAYQCPIPLDPAERAKQSSLRSIAYRRLEHCMHKYIVETTDCSPISTHL